MNRLERVFAKDGEIIEHRKIMDMMKFMVFGTAMALMEASLGRST